MNTAETPSLLLDLVNSRIVWPDGVRDEIGDDAEAAEWLRRHGGSGSADEVAGAREVRPVLVDLLRGLSGVETLGPWIAGMRRRAEVCGDRLEWTLDVPDRLVVGARAVEEWDELQAPSGSRIRPCADPDCQHFLIDRSAANRRRWHAMDQCGNRTKARRHYARTRSGEGVAPVE